MRPPLRRERGAIFQSGATLPDAARRGATSQGPSRTRYLYLCGLRYAGMYILRRALDVL